MMRPKNILTTIALVVSAMALLGAAPATRPILGSPNWPDPNRGLPDSILAFHPPSLFNENEYIGSMFFSKDGWRYCGNLFYFKLGPQLKWGITVSVMSPEGKYYLGKTEIDPKKLVYSKDSVEMKFGESFITGKSPNYHIHFVTDNVTLDLVYNSRTKIWATGENGAYRFGPDDKYFVENEYAALWADVTGYFMVDGKKHPVSGQGYIDHGHANLPFNRHMTAWEGFTAFTWEPINGHMWNITVFDYVTHEEFGAKRLATFAVVKDNKIVAASPQYTIEGSDWRKNPQFNVEFPWRYTLKTTGGDCSLTGVSVAKSTWENLDIMGELPSYVRPIVLKFLRRPVYWRAFGTFDGTLTCGGETVKFNQIPSFHDANYIR